MIQEQMEEIFKNAIPEIEDLFGDDVTLDHCRLIGRDEYNDINKVEATYNFKDTNLDRDTIFNEYKAIFELGFTVKTEEEFIEKVEAVSIPQYLHDWIRQQSIRATSYMYHYINSNYGSFHNWDKRRKIKMLRRFE